MRDVGGEEHRPVPLQEQSALVRKGGYAQQVQAAPHEPGDEAGDFQAHDFGHCLVVADRRELPLRSEEHTSELQSRSDLVCRLLLEKKKNTRTPYSMSAQDTTDLQSPSEIVSRALIHNRSRLSACTTIPQPHSLACDELPRHRGDVH